jgi:hypothetical protein
MDGGCWIGILVKFWDLCQKESKNKMNLEDGPEHATGEEFKESKCAIEECAMEQCTKGGKQL